MASTFSMHSLYTTAPLSVDTAHARKIFEEEDSILLEDNLLDRNGLDSSLDMSPPLLDSRRESFAISNSIFSPKPEDWQTAVEMQSVPSTTGLSETNPFIRLDPSQSSPLGPQQFGVQSNGASWALNTNPASCVPLHAFDGLTHDFDANRTLFQQPLPNQAGYHGQNGMGIFATMASGNPSIPAAASAKDWNHNKSPTSPTIRSHNDLRRGDGIRKKNARFEIPADRNLNNIDHLISLSTDDLEIKELKQQKRLLRNRQAALDSRQRKKLHTERLEDEKKQYTVLVQDLEEEANSLRQKLEMLHLEKQSMQNYVDKIVHEKEEMIQAHTIETGELRKKISVLANHVERLEAASISGTSSMPGGYSAGFDNLGGMPMSGWEEVGYVADFSVQTDIKQESEVVPAPAKKASNAVGFPVVEDDANKPAAQGGLLFMLFLVGAFVLSNRSTPSIPQVSEDVRVASATILESVLKDAGLATSGTSLQSASAPGPSAGAASWPDTSSMVPGGEAGVAPSVLGSLADSLTQPTQEQSNEQLFSLSSSQYNGLNSHEYITNTPGQATSSRRQNLAEALAAMRTPSKESAAEVYTRSLLWDQIPNEVVRNFAKMVAECNSPQGNQEDHARATAIET